MALNAWQKIKRVDSANPFGDGSDGPITVAASADQSQTRRSASGASGQPDLTIASGGFTNGDLVLIIQSRGSGVGQWEINKISSGGGTTTLTMQEDLQYTYTDSGASQAQVIKIPQYTDVTVNSGIEWRAPAWNQDTGGIHVFAFNGVASGPGKVLATGKGYRGSTFGSNSTVNDTGGAAEGTTADATAGGSNSNQGNGGGGGAGHPTSKGAGGGGGGHAAAGTNGTLNNQGGGPTVNGGVGGSQVGDTELTSLNFGGGSGGGGFGNGAGTGTLGVIGGGIIIAIGKTFNGDLVFTCDGVVGNNGTGGTDNGGTGGSAGGSILICGETVALGTALSTAQGKAGGSGAGSGAAGGAGSDGRIAVHYGASVTGTTTPTVVSTLDADFSTATDFAAGIIII